MGKMKELFIEYQEREAYEEAKESSIMESAMLNEFIPLAKINTTKCINCNLDTLSIEEDDITCNSCGQEFIYINNYLKFK